MGGFFDTSQMEPFESDEKQTEILSQNHIQIGEDLTCGDCLDVMAGMEPESVDTIVTDPPYGLKFMGKQWDHGIPGVPFWKAAWRVAKPGAFLLAFGGTRTYHRLTCAIEDAGWKIRDCLMWLYGSGFPKSYDISKGIDKAVGAEREVVGPNLYNKLRGHSTGDHTIKGSQDDCMITAPATSEAKLWEGYGTALKPAWEPVIVAMKPLDGTFVANALKHGVAGLNIDGCRIESGGVTSCSKRAGSGAGNEIPNKLNRKYDKGIGGIVALAHPFGRWPANLILDEVAAVMLDVHVGDLQSGVAVRKHGISDKGIFSFGNRGPERDVGFGDTGGPSRFFYLAKSSKAERNHGVGKSNEHPTVKPVDLMEYLCKLTKTPTGGVVLDPFMGSGTTGVAAIRTGRKFIGIEIEQKSFRTAYKRIKREAQRFGRC